MARRISTQMRRDAQMAYYAIKNGRSLSYAADDSREEQKREMGRIVREGRKQSDSFINDLDDDKLYILSLWGKHLAECKEATFYPYTKFMQALQSYAGQLNTLITGRYD